MKNYPPCSHHWNVNVALFSELRHLVLKFHLEFCLPIDVMLITSRLVDKNSLSKAFCKSSFFFSCNEHSVAQSLSFRLAGCKCPLINGPASSKSWYHTRKGSVWKKKNVISYPRCPSLQALLFCELCEPPGTPSISCGVLLTARVLL